MADIIDCEHSCTSSCASSCLDSEEEGVNALNFIPVVMLVIMSGFFSGLTLGFFALSLEGLDIIKQAGSPEEQRYARRIYPVRKRGNLLLCTLLLGNTLVNALISIFSAQLFSGIVGGLVATFCIVIFGEIIPQSVCQRHGLRIGYLSVPVVVPLMIIFLPVTYPIAAILDWALGVEMRTTFNKAQLDKLFEMHMGGKAITRDDRILLTSALNFAEKRVDAIMTPLKDVFMISVTDVLNFDNLKAIYQSGYTRIPVYKTKRSCVVGAIYSKDLILVDPNDEIPVAAILPFCSRPVNATRCSTTLERMLQEMQSSRTHLWFVSSSLRLAGHTNVSASFRRKLAVADDVIGIVTMEDLIEELISDEIIDESDTITDNISKKQVLEQRAPMRLEFFEMLQRKEVMAAGHGAGLADKTGDEVRALSSYLSNNVGPFRPQNFSIAALRRLVSRCPIHTISTQEAQDGCFVYVRGVSADFCCLLLHGRLQIQAGNEGFASEIGPWTMLAVKALTDPEYKPDFTARVVSQARIFIVPRREFQRLPKGEWGGVIKAGSLAAASELLEGGVRAARRSSQGPSGPSVPSPSSLQGSRPAGHSRGYSSDDDKAGGYHVGTKLKAVRRSKQGGFSRLGASRVRDAGPAGGLTQLLAEANSS